MKVKTRKQRYREINTADNKELNACVIELAERYLNDFPESKGAWLMYSIALYRLDRFSDAKKSLSKTMELSEVSDDGFSWLLCRMGRIYEHSGNFLEAIKWFKKANKSDASEATFLIYLGVMLLKTENYAEAVEILQKATQCEKGCIEEAFYNLAVVRIAQSNYEEAKICLEKAIEIDPKYKEAKQQLKDVTQVIAILETK